jgi:1-acyl-sn-glycerol-3-phosphate acyltransferase
MIRLRSLTFLVVAVSWTLLLSIAYLPLLLASRRTVQSAARIWCRGMIVLGRVICGVRHRIEGIENLPKGRAVIAAKHQAAWDTMVFHTLLDDPIYVLKQELISNPMIGRYLRKAGNIAIDRAAGLRALKGMVAAAEARLAEEAQIIIFPEGTRTAPHDQQPYHPGVAGLYGRCNAPLIPVALNSGLFWDRWTKRPGEIVVSILPALPPDLDRRTMMAELEARIEDETRRLCGSPAVDKSANE